LPAGDIVEFSGTGASGKSYILGEICGDALRKGYDSVIVDDIERRWDLKRLKSFGFTKKHKNFHYIKSPSRCVEECFDGMFSRLDKIMKKSSRVLYIIDPIAALYGRKELKNEDKMGQARAKAIQKSMRFLKDRTGDPNKSLTVLFSNQLIDNVGVMFGPKKRTPGGNALIHWPSIKVRFQSPGELVKKRNGKNITLGILLKSRVVKNSKDDAFRDAEFSIRYGYGIDNIRDCTMWLKAHTTVLGKGPGFNFEGEKIKKDYNFFRYIEKKELEIKLFNLTIQEYKKWYTYEERKEKTRF
jgi:RecA/RadA recombinase